MGTLSSGEDITQNKQAQEALLHAAQQWRTTFDGINDFVSLLDLDGKILRCNMAMKDFVGKPFNEIINHSCWEIDSRNHNTYRRVSFFAHEGDPTPRDYHFVGK